MTLNTYSHLFPDTMELVLDGLKRLIEKLRRPELGAWVLDLKSPETTHVL